MAAALDEIEEDENDAEQFPTIKPSYVDRGWLAPRSATAVLYGKYCRVTAKESIAELYPLFIAATLKEGHEDFDAALLKDGAARHITRAVAAHLYLQPEVDGVEFRSRHGDEEAMWAVFEQPHDTAVSGHFTKTGEKSIDENDPALLEAFELLGLKWAD